MESALKKVVAGAAFTLREIDLMPKLDSQTIQLIIIAVAASAVVMQAIVLVAILFSLKKATISIQAEIKELRSSITPLLFNLRDFLTRVAPRIEETTNDVADIVHGSKKKIAAMEITINDILSRLHSQTSRVDGMISGMLDSVDRVGGYVTDVVAKPVRQISALLSAGKAIIDALSVPAPQTRPTARTTDRDDAV